MILFNIDIYRFNHDTQRNKSMCKLCKKKYMNILNAFIRFYIENTYNIYNYDIVVCDKCFNEKIKEKKGLGLKYLFALQKMKGMDKIKPNIWNVQCENVGGAISKLKELEITHLTARRKNHLVYRLYIPHEEVANVV